MDTISFERERRDGRDFGALSSRMARSSRTRCSYSSLVQFEAMFRSLDVAIRAVQGFPVQFEYIAAGFK